MQLFQFGSLHKNELEKKCHFNANNDKTIVVKLKNNNNNLL